MKKILSLLTLSLFCISCATPTVVNVIGPNDSEMNCKELSAEILKAKQNPKLAGWFVGQVIKATGGKANPQVVNQIVASKLKL